MQPLLYLKKVSIILKGLIMKVLNIVAWVLLVVGGLNWGLVGALDFDLVATVFGAGSVLSRILYILIGLSAIYSVYECKCCSKDSCCK